MKKIIITQLPFHNDTHLCAAVCQNQKLRRIYFDRTQDAIRLHSIYVGKVSKIVKNIQAAFVEIQKGVKCYLPLSDLVHPIFVNKKGKKELAQGDELLVQLAKEPIKTKAAVVTTNLNFSGKYLVLTTGKKQFGISAKLDLERGSQLKALFEPYVNDNREFGIIVRTNAREAEDSLLLQEYERLVENTRNVLKHAAQRTCFSKIYEEEEGILSFIKNTYMSDLSEIVTDDTAMHQTIRQYLTLEQQEDLDKLTFYEDDLLPLYKLYNLPLQLEDALQKRVWLKSGGYLIIEATEAMIVIDVNTGKFEGSKKNREAAFLKINMQAAKEIAKQLQLRNLSGMILIDFISMQKQESIKALINYLKEEIKKDSVKTEFVDITKLGIIELTRKKQQKSLAETVWELYDKNVKK